MRDDDEELLMDSDVEESVGSSHIREAQQTGANLAGSEPLLGQGMADDSLDESMFGVHVAPAVDLKPRVDEEVGRPNVERELEVEARAMSNKASPPPSSSSSTMPQSPDTDVAAIIQDDEGKDDPPKRSKLFLYIAIFALMIVVVAIPLAVVFAQRNNVSASEKEASALRKTAAPATFGPTMFPTTPPTADPTLSPSMPPSSIPSATPTTHTMYPTTTPYPSPAPSSVPTDLPSATPSASQVPSATPSDTPSATPTLSIAPSSTPTATPTAKPSASPSSTPSASPTITAAPTRSSVMRPILAAITPMSILEDPSTPQFRASGWLDDWPPNNYENNTASLFQRYAVATLDFALNPNADTITFGDPLQHVCEWKGVNCTGTNQTQVVGIVWANSSLSGSIPKEIGLLTRLEKLDFGENDIGSSLPSELFELTKLEYLYLHSNRFSGTLSQDFGKLANLVNFYGGDNQFTGSLPRGLGSPGTGAANTRPLRYLSLYKNDIRGTIPDNLNLRQLFYLDLSHNGLLGTFPADWVEDMIRVKNIYLDHNNLRGSLPTNFWDIGKGRLEQFTINDNRFSGTMPGAWTVQNYMQNLQIQNNNFEALDAGVCDFIVWAGGGEMTNFRADCEICICRWWCNTASCY